MLILSNFIKIIILIVISSASQLFAGSGNLDFENLESGRLFNKQASTENQSVWESECWQKTTDCAGMYQRLAAREIGALAIIACGLGCLATGIYFVNQAEEMSYGNFGYAVNHCNKSITKKASRCERAYSSMMAGCILVILGGSASLVGAGVGLGCLTFTDACNILSACAQWVYICCKPFLDN
jgi:hypothetical protein